MVKRILLIHTREICYYSGAFFLHRAEEALELHGAGVHFIELSGDDADWNVLEQFLPENRGGDAYDAVLDINSKLPYLIMEDGRRFLDRLQIPFCNWIVDHPLYHHPGLVFPLQMYHVLTVDPTHAAYVRKHYPHIRSAEYAPVPGTAAETYVRWSARHGELLMPATMISAADAEREIATVCDAVDGALSIAGRDNATLRGLMDALLHGWGEDPFGMPLEEALAAELDRSGTAPADYAASTFAELMNRLYPLDRKVRYTLRRQAARAAARAAGELRGEGMDCHLTILGEGWEDAERAEVDPDSQVRFEHGVRIALSYERIARAKAVIDVNPLFYAGMHDRVPSALINGTPVITCMSEEELHGLTEADGVFYFHTPEELCTQIRRVMTMSDQEGDALSERIRTMAAEKLSWNSWASSFLRRV